MHEAVRIEVESVGFCVELNIVGKKEMMRAS